MALKPEQATAEAAEAAAALEAAVLEAAAAQAAAAEAATEAAAAEAAAAEAAAAEAAAVEAAAAEAAAAEAAAVEAAAAEAAAAPESRRAMLCRLLTEVETVTASKSGIASDDLVAAMESRLGAVWQSGVCTLAGISVAGTGVKATTWADWCFAARKAIMAEAE